ncbi:hypothetical protein HPULCUR_001847 [Helicostylum pulchrum]|uniref:Uncharacterized protein n=1 Tax=Helicostylum pulchrum TaxID=562976 RepID=A0ABP9XQD2_9FUNG
MNQGWNTTTLEYETEYNNSFVQDEDDNESEYSLDYEFPGPRYPNYRTTVDDDDIASQLSDEELEQDAPRFDMWDDDPYNDFTWESNDMQLTKFMKRKKKELNDVSFWKKERGCPQQIQYSCFSTNHDQSANAICLVQSNYGLSEELYAVYRDRIIQCGKAPSQVSDDNNKIHENRSQKRDTTWLERDGEEYTCNINNKFADTRQSVSLSKSYKPITIRREEEEDEEASRLQPFTKYIKRSDYPAITQDSYLSLGFEPQCLAQKYGYMAIGGVEGEFELYCCIDPAIPVKIWGTKFKGKDNVMLMTNSIQLVRWENKITQEYQHMLIGCMNEAGLLFYHLPPHRECKSFRGQKNVESIVKLHSHLRSFNGVPINDTKLSPDGSKLVCVGDDNIVFIIHVFHCNTTGAISFSPPTEMVIPPQIFQQKSMKPTPYSSQYVCWSASSQYFAHTSDSHNLVLIWRTCTREILYAIDAVGYTYAISFHPKLDNILVFTNRYGYFHTIDLSNILRFGQQTNYSRGHKCLATCNQDLYHAVFHTSHLQINHEITMVSFRGEIDTRLRILAKINGIEWSKDGNYLYLATKKRVLAYQFNMTQVIPSLLDITGGHVKKILEQSCSKRKKPNKTLYDWSRIPHHIQSRILGDTQELACHR